MNKAYTRIVWHNYPNTTTPLNETNLNKMDYALDVVDDRIILLYENKADLDEEGLLAIGELPETSKIVLNDTERFALTTDDVKNGFIVVVRQPKTKMWLVTDDTNLDSNAGYDAFAAEADWNDLVNRPTNLAYLAGDDEELPSVSPVLRESSLQNNLTTTLPNYPLDARQGKVLDDKITTLNSNLAELNNNNMNNYVDVSSATSSNPYVFTSDGYLRITASGSSVYIKIAGATSGQGEFLVPDGVREPIYVKKGMRFFGKSGGNGSLTAYFWAFI